MHRVRAAFVIASAIAATAFACSAYDEQAPAVPTTNDAGTDAAVVTPTDGGGGADAAPAPTWFPPQGTYRYRVDGRQRLSLGQPEYRDEGPTAPAEIRHDTESGCWRFRICLVSGQCDDKPSSAYSEIAWRFCVVDGRLEERSAHELMRWSVFNTIQQAISAVECAPGQAQYASRDFSLKSWGHVCSGKVDGAFSFGSSGTYLYIGEEDVVVGGATVRAHHYAEERAVSANEPGAPSGRQLGEWWLAPNGLPLRVRRGANIDTDIGFGSVHFRQFAKTPFDAGPDAGGIMMNDCVLDSLEPAALPDAGE